MSDNTSTSDKIDLDNYIDEIYESVEHGTDTRSELRAILGALAEEARREKSDLMRMVSWLKQRKKERKKAMITGDVDKTDENLYYYEAFSNILEIAEREYKEAN